MKQYSFLQESFLVNGSNFSQVGGIGSVKYSYMIFNVISAPINKLKMFIKECEDKDEIRYYITKVFKPEIEYRSIRYKDDIADVCKQVSNSISDNITMQLSNSMNWKEDCIKSLDSSYLRLLVSHIMTGAGLVATGAIVDKI